MYFSGCALVLIHTVNMFVLLNCSLVLFLIIAGLILLSVLQIEFIEVYLMDASPLLYWKLAFSLYGKNAYRILLILKLLDYLKGTTFFTVDH